MSESMYDLVIRGGTIVDGSGSEPFVGDVAVRGDLAGESPRIGRCCSTEETIRPRVARVASKRAATKGVAPMPNEKEMRALRLARRHVSPLGPLT